MSLRDYCRSRHVVWRDFLSWASSSEIAGGLPEVERCKKQTPATAPLSMSAPVSHETRTSLFHPLQIKDSPATVETPSGGADSFLRGIRITLPGGITITIREGSGSEIARILQLSNR